MKQIIFILFLLISLDLSAQDSTSKSPIPKKTSFGLIGAPEIVFSSIQNTIYPKQETKPAFGLALGITGERFLSNKFALKGSLGYNLKKSRLLLNGLVLISDIDPNTGEQISESKIETIFIQGEVFAQISGVFYPINQKVFFSGGIELSNVLRSTSTETIIMGNGTESAYEMNYAKFFNFAPCLSVGYNIFSKNRKIITVEPFFRSYLRNYGHIRSSEIMLNTFALRTTFWF